jgi:hypothetical protein
MIKRVSFQLVGLKSKPRTFFKKDECMKKRTVISFCILPAGAEKAPPRRRG